jgi:hypothetical protein
MPEAQITKEIKAPAEKIYQILIDHENDPRWNITVNEANIISDTKASYKTTVGDLTLTERENIKNEKIAYDVEGNPLMKTMDYIIKSKGENVCDVTLAAEFPEPDQEPILMTAGDVLLNSLKKYAEYLEEGGDPSSYKKK